MPEISPKARLVLEYIHQRIEEGFPPSVREICSQLGIKSTSTAHKYITELQENGFIEKGDKLNRAIRLPQDPRSHSRQVPLLGTVAAGQPILAVEQIEGYIPFRAEGIFPTDELFALHVRGESMLKIGILNEDIIIVHRTSTAYNGEVVVALIDDEATVKRFYKEKNGYRLQPENDTMEPIFTKEIQILGKVIALYREFK